MRGLDDAPEKKQPYAVATGDGVWEPAATEAEAIETATAVAKKRPGRKIYIWAVTHVVTADPPVTVTVLGSK